MDVRIYLINSSPLVLKEFHIINIFSSYMNLLSVHHFYWFLLTPNTVPRLLFRVREIRGEDLLVCVYRVMFCGELIWLYALVNCSYCIILSNLILIISMLLK